MRHEHFGSVPLGDGSTKVIDNMSRLLHQMDRSLGCSQNHDIASDSINLSKPITIYGYIWVVDENGITYKVFVKS